MNKLTLLRLATVLFLPLGWVIASVAATADQASLPATPVPSALPAAQLPAAQSLATQSDTIALVTVTSVSSLVNRAMSVSGLLSVEAYSYQLDVQRQWKGKAVDQAVMTVSVQQCSRPLNRGERYLIFGEAHGTTYVAADAGHGRVDALAQPAQDSTPRSWLIRSCDQAIPAGQAQAHVVQLNQLYHPPVAHHQP